jgi:G3E family GTPase
MLGMQVELSNGCICCTLRDDLVTEIIKVAKSGNFDYVIVEASGIAEPMQVAEAFTMSNKDGEALRDFAYLDTAVSVVDAFNWMHDYYSSDNLTDRGTAAFEGDERHVVKLLVDQVEFANVLIVNKCDLVTPPQLAEVLGSLRVLNSKAKLLTAVRGNVALQEVVHTNRFSMDDASKFPGWLEPEHTPETTEYNISSFVFRSKRPFHPDRLYNILYPPAGVKNALDRVVRSKGFFWLAADGGMDDCGIWAQAGKLASFILASSWQLRSMSRACRALVPILVRKSMVDKYSKETVAASS